MFNSLKTFLNKFLLINLINLILITLSTSELFSKETSKINDIFLILVNKENPLSKSYIPFDLIEITKDDNIDYIIRENEQMYINKEVLNNYKLLYNEALSHDLNLTIFSGYRSFEKQQALWDNNKDIGYLAPPGYSEHQTGFAIDVSTRNTGLTTNLTNTKEYQFLINNAYKYGFIIRYPKNKEKITGYYFEPWHLRYVGIAHSTKINNKKITLEEYLS